MEVVGVTAAKKKNNRDWKRRKEFERKGEIFPIRDAKGGMEKTKCPKKLGINGCFEREKFVEGRKRFGRAECVTHWEEQFVFYVKD
jgi:hypothetical protein